MKCATCDGTIQGLLIQTERMHRAMCYDCAADVKFNIPSLVRKVGYPLGRPRSEKNKEALEEKWLLKKDEENKRKRKEEEDKR